MDLAPERPNVALRRDPDGALMVVLAFRNSGGSDVRLRRTLTIRAIAGLGAVLFLSALLSETGIVRSLAIVRQALGSLDRVKRVLRVTVYVQSAADFTQQSEVADAASEILYTVLSPAGGHTRTSVGVYQLPKNGSVEIDMVVAITPK